MKDPWNSDYKSLQGNIGLGCAIAYFTSIGYPVMIPLNDTQKYDLVVDIDGKLNRISVKTTKFIGKSGKYIVQLKNSGGSSGTSVIRNFDNTSCDMLFIYTREGSIYLIHSSEIKSKTSIALSNLFDKFLVNSSTPEETQDVKAS